MYVGSTITEKSVSQYRAVTEQPAMLTVYLTLIVFPSQIQYNTIQYNTIQYNTIQYNTDPLKQIGKAKLY